jgi:biopolymer transport protein ExbB
MNFFSTVATFYKDGGLFMHAVLAIAVVIVAIVVERALVLRRAAGGGRRFIDDVVQRATRGDVSGARQLALASSTPQGRVAQAMLAAGGDAARMEAAGDDAATLILPDLTRRLAYLGMLANSATLLGLLGTITGLITAIAGVGVADAAQRSAYLTAGIAEALHTTAFGLMVAIPTLGIQTWLNGRVESIISGLDELCIRLSQAVAGPAEAASARPAAAPHLAPVQPLRAPSAQAAPRAATGTHGAGA